jgi:hypothetical protein
MVGTNLIIGIVAIAVVVLVVLFLIGNRPTSNVPVIDDAIAQTAVPILTSVSTQGLVGFDENKATINSTVDEIKNNLATGNLVDENAIRSLDEQVKDTVQVNTLTDGGVQTREVGGLTLVKTGDSELRILDAFDPVGEGDFIGISGKPLGANAIARTQETFTGEITTASRGTRTIRGSKALFERLQQNLLNQ